MARTKTPKVHFAAVVSLDDYEFIPGDVGHCPIANALKAADPDILSPRVTDKNIQFSRRSTGKRYIYQTPSSAVRFIHAVDALPETHKIPKGLNLVLTDYDLIKVRDRDQSSVAEGLRQAKTRKDAVQVRNGKVTVKPKRSTAPNRTRPNRLNTAPH